MTRHITGIFLAGAVLISCAPAEGSTDRLLNSSCKQWIEWLVDGNVMQPPVYMLMLSREGLKQISLSCLGRAPDPNTQPPKPERAIDT